MEKKPEIKWYNRKTNRLAIAAVLAAIAGYLTGELSLTGLFGSMFAAGGTIFMRQGVSKSGVPPLSERGETLDES